MNANSKNLKESNKTPKFNTHLASPSSRIACSSALQSIEIPGLCFMAMAAPELSGADTGAEFPLLGLVPLNDDEAWLGSWWFPDGLAINNSRILKINKVLNSSTESDPNPVLRITEFGRWFPPISVSLDEISKTQIEYIIY